MSVRDRMKMFEQKAKEGSGITHSRSKTISSKPPSKLASAFIPESDAATLPARVSPAVKRRSRTAGDLGATAAAAVASVRAEQNRDAAGGGDAGRVKRLSTMLGGLNIPLGRAAMRSPKKKALPTVEDSETSASPLSQVTMARPVASGSGRKRRTRNKGAARALAASLEDDNAPLVEASQAQDEFSASTSDQGDAVADSQSAPAADATGEEETSAPLSHSPPNTGDSAFAASASATEDSEFVVAAVERAALEYHVSFPAGGLGIKLAKPNSEKYARVKQIMPGGPADTGGVQVGDLLIAIGGDDQLGGEQLALQNTVRRVQSSLAQGEEAVYTFKRV